MTVTFNPAKALSMSTERPKSKIWHKEELETVCAHHEVVRSAGSGQRGLLSNEDQPFCMLRMLWQPRARSCLSVD